MLCPSSFSCFCFIASLLCFIPSLFVMAPFGLISYGQNVIDEIKNQQLVEEYIAKHGHPGSSTPAPPIFIADDADLSVNTHTSSEETNIDQSNNSISFINLHWASFSTGLSSVLAVVVLLFLIARCCYFRGKRQRQ